MSYIEPLQLQTWIINVLSGTPEIFMALGLFFVAGMAGFFGITTLGMIFLMVTFLLMFSGYISSILLMLIILIGGLILGYMISSIFAR